MAKCWMSPGATPTSRSDSACGLPTFTPGVQRDTSLTWFSPQLMTYMRSTAACCEGICAQPPMIAAAARTSLFTCIPLLKIGSSERRHIQARRRRVLVRPARRHRLGARVELDALRAVHVQIAEQRALPPAERIERNGYGN